MRPPRVCRGALPHWSPVAGCKRLRHSQGLSAWVRALDGRSGVYVIREPGLDGKPEIVYVGSSSAGGAPALAPTEALPRHPRR